MCFFETCLNHFTYHQAFEKNCKTFKAAGIFIENHVAVK